MLRWGIDGSGVFLQMVETEQASVTSHTAILPSVAALNSRVYLRDAEMGADKHEHMGLHGSLVMKRLRNQIIIKKL